MTPLCKISTPRFKCCGTPVLLFVCFSVWILVRLTTIILLFRLHVSVFRLLSIVSHFERVALDGWLGVRRQCKHPNVVSLIGAVLHDECLYLVMGYERYAVHFSFLLSLCSGVCMLVVANRVLISCSLVWCILIAEAAVWRMRCTPVGWPASRSPIASRYGQKQRDYATRVATDGLVIWR